MIHIRLAEKTDAPAILELIRELAVYEKAPLEVTNTVEAILEDGFGNLPAFQCLMGEFNGEIAGLSLWYTRYSTWKGKMLYLEDLIVKEAFRGKGIGKKLFEATIQAAKEGNYQGMTWQVLDWNEPAIGFYRQYAADFDGEWINVKLLKDRFADF